MRESRLDLILPPVVALSVFIAAFFAAPLREVKVFGGPTLATALILASGVVFYFALRRERESH